jgi:hypothetical protein
MRNKFQQFMNGRYGVDGLGKATLVIALIFLVLNMFIPKAPFYLLALVFLAISYFRMFSRNINKRYAENQWFESKFARIRQMFSKSKNYSEIRKTNRIFVCPNCKQKVKVPKGKGRISIHCPKCGTDFIKRS